jgi:hypothetical protein
VEGELFPNSCMCGGVSMCVESARKRFKNKVRENEIKTHTKKRDKKKEKESEQKSERSRTALKF